MKKQLIVLLPFLLLLSCEKPADWDLQNKETNLLVVEALLTNELKNHSVKLTHTVTDINQKPIPVTGAAVAVSDGNNVAVFIEYPTGSGVYYSDSVQAVIGKKYYLFIDDEGSEYVASDEMVPVAPMKSIKYKPASKEEYYEIVFQDSSDPSFKEYWISWSHLPGYETEPIYSTTARVQHYTLKSIDVNEMFKPDKKKVYFPKGSYILRRKYSLSEVHQSFLRTMLSETDWRGSIFDIQKGNVLTNLSMGAIGFFAVSTVVSDTTIVK